MKTNKSNRIFRGLTISLVLCALIISTLSPVAFAASTPVWYAKINVSTLNVRTGPGLSYEIAYSATTGDIIGLDGNTYESDGYTWYYLADKSGCAIADTGGWTLLTSSPYDYISCFDGYGELVFDHECPGDGTDDWGYWIDVDVRSYLIRCSCGWSYCRYAAEKISYNAAGEWLQTIYFLGLDTDNDERVDLYPGQSKFLPNRSFSSLRKYTLLEFYDVERPTPTVSLVFQDENGSELARYQFDWSVDVYAESYGIRMVGFDGFESVYFVENDFLCRDLDSDVILGDVGLHYEIDQSLVDLNGLPLFRHMEFCFVISAPGEGGRAPMEWIIYICRWIGDYASEIFSKCFGFVLLFTDDDSPFKFLLGG